MRRIHKCRAWDSKYNAMIEGFAIYDNADHLGISLSDAEKYYTPEQIEDDSVHFCGSDGDWLFILNEFELLQFTGLTDKNGKEIYEGDICRTDVNGKLWVVRWENYGWELINHQIKEPKQRMAGDEQYSFQKYLQMLKKASATIEVIGNIYENPELPEP